LSALERASRRCMFRRLCKGRLQLQLIAFIVEEEHPNTLKTEYLVVFGMTASKMFFRDKIGLRGRNAIECGYFLGPLVHLLFHKCHKEF